ncbi:DUF3253 domain-containing protein [Methylobacterium oxalidis]|uniref:DUF3253 domain-containing protein n=1 Tax=Methylobacterium oxalidis TaxID=944322 RepID=A0A512J530_9HYPH|nr:DUF3253 domain-containing protein [Methylobacterium oxalidis]GEP05068.1 hypothetical protein MOX02_31060 [Methylobacterium oxalidis]GJE34762.1 hypothetical protein LDDCCGHA_4976 [Methylobacterium oxalidis]GLS65653.1 hypothetical protein GCM10007888_40350 [Methylobacterium oxalidis]
MTKPQSDGLKARASEEAISETMLRLVAERGAGKTICPSEVARALGGPHPDGWGPLMQPVRRVAVRLMKAGRVAILRKGRPVPDPDDFRGVYRLAAGPEAGSEDDASAGAGKPSAV